MKFYKREFTDTADGEVIYPQLSMSYGFDSNKRVTEISNSESYFSSASADCYEDDYTVILGRPSAHSLTLKVNWTSGCNQPSRSKIWLSLYDAATTNYALTCLKNGASHIQNRRWVLPSNGEVIAMDEYTMEQASYCVKDSETAQTLTLVTNVDESYISTLRVNLIVEEHERNIVIEKQIPLQNLTVNSSCIELPGTFRPEVAVNVDTPQTVIVECGVPNYLLEPMQCTSDKRGINFTSIFQYDLFGTVTFITVSGEIDPVNGECVITENYGDHAIVTRELPQPIKSCSYTETGVKFYFKDKFFHDIVQLSNTIKMRVTCGLGDYIPSAPIVITLTDIVSGMVINFREKGGDATKFIPTSIPDPHSTDLLGEIMNGFVYAVIVFGTLLILIMLTRSWMNDRKRKELNSRAMKAGIKSGAVKVYSHKVILNTIPEHANDYEHMLILKGELFDFL